MKRNFSGSAIAHSGIMGQAGWPHFRAGFYWSGSIPRDFRIFGLKMRSGVKTHYFEAVYDVVRQVPCGRVTTYGAIADFLALGSARMTGWALRNLSGEDDVPAHRVVNRTGELTGRHHFPHPDDIARRLKKEGVKVVGNKVQNFEKYFWHPADELL